MLLSPLHKESTTDAIVSLRESEKQDFRSGAVRCEVCFGNALSFESKVPCEKSSRGSKHRWTDTRKTNPNISREAKQGTL